MECEVQSGASGVRKTKKKKEKKVIQEDLVEET